MWRSAVGKGGRPGLLQERMTGCAARVGNARGHVLRLGICLGVATCVAFAATSAFAESLPEALAKAYQTNPQLNAERARQRATDENVPQALAGYRPQIIASLSAGLQAVRNLLPDNMVQGATLKPWQIGVTVTQTLFNGFKTANSVRVAELQVQSGREALRNTGQGVLLDAVTAYSNVLANQSLVEAQRSNVEFLRETLRITQRRLKNGDVTETDTAQAEARLNRGRWNCPTARSSIWPGRVSPAWNTQESVPRRKLRASRGPPRPSTATRRAPGKIRFRWRSRSIPP